MSTVEARSAGFHALLAATLCLALLLVCPGGGGCGAGELHAMPPALVGTWKTADRRYKGRTLEIHARSVVLGDLGHPIDRYHIETIRSWKNGNGEVFELRCVTDEGVQDTLRLTLVADSPAYVKVGAAPAHWTRSHSR